MMLIGEASKISGASIKAIRHYDSLGLLPNLDRSGTYRIFTVRDINTIKLIKQAQEVGFKLSEFKAIFLKDENPPSWHAIKESIELKRLQVIKEITALEKKKALLIDYAKSIHDCLEDDPDCSAPLI